jgi:hypothetical protein
MDKMTIIPLSDIDGFTYFMHGSILFMPDPNSVYAIPPFVPFGIYNVDKDEIKLYKDWDEKIEKIRRKIQQVKEDMIKGYV